jgi:hypothetical protein
MSAGAHCRRTAAVRHDRRGCATKAMRAVALDTRVAPARREHIVRARHHTHGQEHRPVDFGLHADSAMTTTRLCPS